MRKRSLFCIGLGYSALELARRLLPQGWRISGTCREAGKATALSAEGIDAVIASPDHPPDNPAQLLEGVTHILISVPPDAEGDPAFAMFGEAIRRHAGLDWLGYLSTTGVYGDRQGDWVDESSPLLPSGERGGRRVFAERQWLSLFEESGVPVHLFRLAGIYGRGRSALETVRSGRAQRVVKAGQVFSRTHVEDIATILEASIARPNPGAAYNVCDDDPAPPDEVIAYAAELLGVAPPPQIAFETAQLSEMARSFYADNKRVSNRRIKQELGVRLAYPSYRDGLTALAADGTPQKLARGSIADQ